MKRYVGERVIGGVLTVGSCTILAGWLLHLPLWRVFAGPALPVPGAMCFLLFGLVLLGVDSGYTHTRRLRAAIWTGALIATLTFLETAFSLDLGIDVPSLHSWYADGNPYPGRISPNTSLALALAAFALNLRIKHKDKTLSQGLPAVVITLAVMGLIAYLSLFDLAYEWYRVPRMSIIAACGLLLLGLVLIPQRQMHTLPTVDETVAARSTYEQRGYAFFAVAVTILSGLALVSYGSIRALIERKAWVEHTAAVTIEFEALGTAIADIRGAWRTYAATNDPLVMQEILNMRARVFSHLDHLSTLTADNPAQQARLTEIRRVGHEVSTILEQGNFGRGVPTDPPQAAARWNTMAIDREHFQTLVDEFRREEENLLAKRRHDSNQGVHSAIWVIVGGNVLGFAIMFLAAGQLKRQNNLRDRLLIALQESHAFLDSLIEQIPSLITVKDAKDLRVLRINRAGEEILGVKRADTIGKTNYDLFPPDLAKIYTATDRAALGGENALRVSEQTVMTRGEGTRVVHTTKVPIHDEAGRPIYLLTIAEDITERKLAEQEIAALNQRLTARANELEASNKELESFAYSVSHDLRAPLRAINGYALMLEEDYRDKLDEEAMRYIALMRSYSRHMGTLIDDLLRLSRFGRQALQIVDIDISRLVREVLAEEVREYGFGIEVVLGELPDVRADAQLLRMVWSNLIANAFKYSSKTEKPLIEIEGHRDAHEATFSVKDNGVGFDMAYYEKLFSVFHRLHRNDEFPGTGVGLAIVHRIVIRHGGRVWAEGVVGQGATFYFSLPNSTEPA